MANSLQRIRGVRLALRLITPDDANYVFALRSDGALNPHLSAVTGDAQDQRRWIEAYKPKEAAGEQLYYVIERLDNGAPCGLVRLYDISESQFMWGSWVLGANKPPKAALESALLSLGVGFELLCKPKARIEVRHDNHKAIAFYERFGMIAADKEGEHRYYEYSHTQYEQDKAKHMAHLTMSSSNA